MSSSPDPVSKSQGSPGSGPRRQIPPRMGGLQVSLQREEWLFGVSWGHVRECLSTVAPHQGVASGFCADCLSLWPLVAPCRIGGRVS